MFSLLSSGRRAPMPTSYRSQPRLDLRGFWFADCCCDQPEQQCDEESECTDSYNCSHWYCGRDPVFVDTDFFETIGEGRLPTFFGDRDAAIAMGRSLGFAMSHPEIAENE